MAFHETRFPTGIARNSSAGPERRTEIVVLGSGREERNTRWAHSRRKYNAGYGVKTLSDLQTIIAFFEERRGRLYGFRWKDMLDHSSALPEAAITNLDQPLGLGDGVNDTFQLIKQYGTAHAPYTRTITKPVAGTVVVAVNGAPKTETSDYTLDLTTGLITFGGGSIPAVGEAVTAGFEFDVPVRFDTDHLKVNLTQFRAGDIPDIPIIEIRI